VQLRDLGLTPCACCAADTFATCTVSTGARAGSRDAANSASAPVPAEWSVRVDSGAARRPAPSPAFADRSAAAPPIVRRAVRIASQVEPQSGRPVSGAPYLRAFRDEHAASSSLSASSLENVARLLPAWPSRLLRGFPGTANLVASVGLILVPPGNHWLTFAVGWSLEPAKPRLHGALRYRLQNQTSVLQQQGHQSDRPARHS
jgi:hypothetical protein